MSFLRMVFFIGRKLKKTSKKGFKLASLFIIIYLVYILLNYYQIYSKTTNEHDRNGNFIKDPNIKNSPEKVKKSKPKLNWIVVTSISEPTSQIKNLANIKDFQLVVIGDKKTNQNWNYNNTIYLSIKTQESLNYKTFTTTPFNSYTRKNIGYLFAIQNGAKFIYDTDDDNEPLVNLNEYFNFNKYDYGMIIDCKSPRVMNPYAHFGQPLIWPRGYPLSEIQQNHYNGYICGKRKTSYVQQGVVNGDPDVDAIFSMYLYFICLFIYLLFATLVN
jgi:hypothetical protein